VPSLTPIGTIRTFQVKSSNGDYYKLTRLAILKEYRKYRFGRELVEFMHEWVKAHALETNADGRPVTIVCHSQLPVQGFYAK
jgi:GNAT superfamily N-acetyltransferase